MKQDQPTDQHTPDPGLRIAWWNTGLSPTRAPDRASEADFKTAAGVLRHLISKTKAQVIVLGEMATTSVALLRHACPIAERLYEWIEAFQSAGKSRFSVCVLSRKKRLKVTFEEIITHVRDGRVSKIGQHFIAIPHKGPPIHVIASHWPGRLHLHRSDSFRTHIAAHLREWIDRHLLATDAKANVVLLGDFNDEPFDEGVEHYLKASRDSERVRQVPSLFYNPFWRHMSSFGRENERACSHDCGTYFHAGGTLTRWRTFDQMIFSSALLVGRSGWRLNEAHTHVARMPDFKGVVTSSTSFFDHFPSLATWNGATPMLNFSHVIRRGLSRAAEAADERCKIARLFESISSAIQQETGGLVELHLDQSESETFSEFHNNFAHRTRIVVRSVAEPSRETVLARGSAAADGGLPFELSLDHESVYCCDLEALESRLSNVLGSAEAGKAIHDLML